MIRLLASSVAVARRAGQHIRDVLQSGKLAVVEKGVDDPQTEADRRSQRCILASLKSQYPNVTVIGEEDLPPSADDQRLRTDAKDESVLSVECPKIYKGIEEKDISIWVDPLYGTSEFTAGFLDRVTVLIGIAIGSEPIAGVIYQPFYQKTPDTLPGRMIWGMMGVGIRGDFTPAELPPQRQIVASTRTHGSELFGEDRRNYWQRCTFGEKSRNCAAVRKIQMCMQLAIDVQFPPVFGGLGPGRNCRAFLHLWTSDTEGGFVLERVTQIAKAAQQHLCNVARVSNKPGTILHYVISKTPRFGVHVTEANTKAVQARLQSV
ncbi:3'(2'),5'-bisphosphate nucleotidase 1-like [Oscarella lobularis]|uniref:3'(2'),5'-bisphosphate nucleotidase 1-like n=1 Tax=Oscarella lobularis TaxID=121494 RepID=UPI0033131DD3